MCLYTLARLCIWIASSDIDYSISLFVLHRIACEYLPVMEIRTGTIASGGHIKGSVLLKDTTVVGGVLMFKFPGAADYLITLLGLDRRDTKKLVQVLGKNVVPQLKTLRLSEYVKFCQLPGRGVHPPRPESDIPKIATIAPPNFPGIVAPLMQVAMDGPRYPLRIQLSTANIKYLSKVCTLLLSEAAGDQQGVEQKQQGEQKRVEKTQRTEKKQRVDKKQREEER